MKVIDLIKYAQDIVNEACQLNAAHTTEKEAPVNYACIFAQTESDYDEFIGAARQLGTIVQETKMGPVFLIGPIPTAAGPLELLKIRRPDARRREMGDADFTVTDYHKFKKTYLGKPGFGIIKRSEMEMIELIDPLFNAVAYYSYPTLADVLRNQQAGQ